MTTKLQAKAKIAAAEKGCNAVHDAWSRASNVLAGNVSVNGCGIFHGPHEIRRMLLSAQDHIKDALRELDGIDWPADADYDRF